MISDEISQAILGNEDAFPDILGQSHIKQMLKSTLLSGRHSIMVGPPGVGKTTLARSVQKLLKDAPFVRIQGSPDLSSEDLLGDIDPVKALKFGPMSTEAFTKGKIFKADKGILFFDELNRCPEKVQNALLQVLEEKKATIGSYDVDFDLDFIFIATMNPEDSSTEKLSDVLVDRFDFIYMSYPENHELEETVVKNKGAQRVPVDSKLLQVMVHFVRLLREDKNLEKKPSVRATLGLYDRAQAHAQIQGNKETTFEDLQAVTVSVIAHRIRLKPSLRYMQSPEKYIADQFQKHIVESGVLEDKKGDLL